MDGIAKMTCPDDGTCHHGCTGSCFRVKHCEPLSAAGWGSEWPDKIRIAHGLPPLAPVMRIRVWHPGDDESSPAEYDATRVEFYEAVIVGGDCYGTLTVKPGPEDDDD